MGFEESAKRADEQGRERAKDIVAKIPAEPGWRACIVLPGKDLEGGKREYHLSLPQITHWGIRRPTSLFGPAASCAFAPPLFGVGGASAPIPMSEYGLVLNVDGFWGLAAPHESEEEVFERFRAEFERPSADPKVPADG